MEDIPNIQKKNEHVRDEICDQLKKSRHRSITNQRLAERSESQI